MTIPHQPTPSTPLCICPICHRFTGMGVLSTVGVHYKDGFLCSGSGGWTSRVEPVEGPTPPPPSQTPARGEGVQLYYPGHLQGRVHGARQHSPTPSGGVHPGKGVPAGGVRTRPADTGLAGCLHCTSMDGGTYCSMDITCPNAPGHRPTTQEQDTGGHHTQCALCWTEDHGLCAGAGCRCTHLVCAPRRQGG